MVYSDPNNTNSIVYQHTLLSYQLKTSHWNFPRAATWHLCNMADRGEKLQQPHCYHPFSDSRDTYLTKTHYENYSPKMVPTNPTGSWTTVGAIPWCTFILYWHHILWRQWDTFHMKYFIANATCDFPGMGQDVLDTYIAFIHSHLESISTSHQWHVKIWL